MADEKYIYGKVSIQSASKQRLDQLNLVYNKNVLILEVNGEQSRFKLGDAQTDYINLPYITGYTLSKEDYDTIVNGGFVTIDDDDKISEDLIPDIYIKKDNVFILKAGDANDAVIMQALYAKQ